MYKLKKKGGYKSSFARNLHERTDNPVFTIAEAVADLKRADPTRGDVEKDMDQFFLSHLPEEILQEDADGQYIELDEVAIREQKRLDTGKKKKTRTHAQIPNVQAAKVMPLVEENQKPRRGKSDFMDTFTDSAKQVDKLEKVYEDSDKLSKMRKSARASTRNPGLKKTVAAKNKDGPEVFDTETRGSVISEKPKTIARRDSIKQLGQMKRGDTTLGSQFG